MNKQRRKDIESAQAHIDEAKSIIANARDEEQDYFDNMPENFQYGEKGEAAETAINALDEFEGMVDDAMDHIYSECGI